MGQSERLVPPPASTPLRSEIVNVPNALSLLRLLLLGLFFVELFVTNQRVVASVLLALAGTTDFLDGYAARRLHQVTNFGKALDPTIDRLLFFGAVIALVLYGAVPIWLAALVLGREAIVSLTMVAVLALRSVRIDVLYIGKVGTFALMCCLPLLLVSDGRGSWCAPVRLLAWVLTYPSLAVSLAAMLAYLPRVREAFGSGRSS